MSNTDKEKGDAFVAELAKLARKHGIEPWHAMQCFGKVAAMLVEYELLRGRLGGREEAFATLMAEFERGIQSYPFSPLPPKH
jgi:hypothetical protein